MAGLVPPHGGRGLKPLQVRGDARAEETRRAQTLKRLRIRPGETGDLVMMGIGGFRVVAGFMTHADWQHVCDEMRTSDGLFWPIPITLSTHRAVADSIAIGEDIALIDPDDDSPLAVISVTE